MYFDNAEIGGGQDATLSITTSGIINAIGDVVQVTGIATVADAYYRITAVGDETNISVGRTTGDPELITGQVVFHVGRSVSITSSSFSDGTTTFNCSSPHGLVAGNKFRLTDSSNNNLGDYFVKSRVGVNTFTANTTQELTSPTYILKHFFSSNDGISDASDENLSKRSSTFYDKDTLLIDNGGSEIGITTTLIPIVHTSSGIGTEERFPLGSYIQVDNEIMRVSSSTLSGTNKLNVIRGVLSSQSTPHDDGSIIKKIRPLPVEFRRPSIIRASGHTFEYLGYGPGNYSTGLPQVQTRTLTEREEFLSQAQERSSGIVVYTGMNNRGDFYIGNTKKSSATGEETSFDTPIPTVTGENPARLSAIFDEITVKERIVVEGGDSGEILSQFDGPVTFNNNVRIKDNTSITGKLRILDTSQSTSTSTGALVVDGGVGIAKNLYVGGDINIDGNISVDGLVSLGGSFRNIQIGVSGDNTIDTSTGNLNLCAPSGSVVSICTNTTISGTLQVTDDITAFWTSDERLKDNISPITDSLTKVVSISGNTFDWNEKSNKSGHDVGLIAQEIEQVLPEAVVTRDNGYLAVDYHKVVPLLVEAIKELSGKVKSLEQKLSDK